MITIEPMSEIHATDVLEIYQQGIDTGMATFETNAPTWVAFDEKHLPHSRLVAVDNNEVCGWSALTPVSLRECYSGVAELSVYVKTDRQSKGIGNELLKNLVSKSEHNGIWSLLSVIDEKNLVSIHLHTKNGFRTIGYRERIAKLNGAWRTTIMMERRSKIVGV